MPTTTSNLLIDEVSASQSDKSVTLDSALEALDQAIAGTYVLDTTAGGTFDLLSFTQNGWPAAMCMRIKLTGTPSAGVTIKSPLTMPKVYFIDNQCGQTATVEGATGGSQSVATSTVGLVYCDGTNVVSIAPAAPAGAAPYDIPFFFGPGKPDAGQVMAVRTVRQVTFPANFAASGSAVDSDGECSTNPTSSATFTVADNGTTIGSIVISTGGSFSFTTVSGTSKVVSAKHTITITAPGSQDATLAGVALTITGTR